jgi:hypothetical protein
MDDAALDFSVEAPDPAIARAERRLRLLERLTEIGMALAEGLRDQVMYPEACKTPVEDPADAFARISRAVRLTIALESKTDQELADLKAGVVSPAREAARAKADERAKEDARRAERAAEKAREDREERVSDLVLAVAESEAADREEFDGLMDAILERLGNDSAYADIEGPPLREIVERLCKDLDLHPDWSHWTGEGWDQHYHLLRDRWDEFNQPSRKPIDPEFNRFKPINETLMARIRQLE